MYECKSRKSESIIIYNCFMHLPYRLIALIALLSFVNISSSATVRANDQTLSESITYGYSTLKIFLEDEQYLTAIRRTKMLITFSDISDSSRKLIDDIANSSEQALQELKKIAQEKPPIAFEEFSDETIAKATLDSLRMTTAKEFLFETEDFEKNLLLSQLKVLPVISHLAEQLEKKETNQQRRVWLNKLANRYEKYYQQVNANISIASKNRRALLGHT